MSQEPVKLVYHEPVEINITLSGEEKKKLSKSFLIYEQMTLSRKDPHLRQCIKELLDEFKDVVDYIKINVKIILRDPDDLNDEEDDHETQERHRLE